MLASSGLATPPTTLQSWFAARDKGPRVGGGRNDPEDDVDAVTVDLDALDQGPDQVALERPVDLGHPSPHPLREVLEPADDQRQGRPQGGLVPQGRGPLLPARDPLSQAGDARLELGLVDQAFGVAVDEPRRGAAQLRDLVSISPSSGPPLTRRRASSRRRSYSAAIRAGSRSSRSTSRQTAWSSRSVRTCAFEHTRWPPKR